VPRDAADAATAAGAGAADPDVRPLGLHTPGADLLGAFGKRPAERSVKDVAAWKAKLRLQLERRECLQAGLPVGIGIKQSWIGSANTEFSESSVALMARCLAPGSPNSRAACAARTP